MDMVNHDLWGSARKIYSPSQLVCGKLHMVEGTDGGEDGSLMVVEVSKDHLCPAKQAVSCLIVPRGGDMALCWLVERQAYVIQILERENASDDAVLTVPECRKLMIVQPEIATRTSKIRHDTSDFRLNADSSLICSDKLTFMSRVIDTICRMARRVVDNDSSLSKNSVTIVKENEVRSSGVYRHKVDSAYSLKSEVTLMESDKDTRIDGERILMG